MGSVVVKEPLDGECMLSCCMAFTSNSYELVSNNMVECV